jgi:hypothetical protein
MEAVRKVIATYSFWRCLPILTFLLLVTAVGVSAWYSPNESVTANLFHHGIVRPYFMIGGTLSYIVMLPKIFAFIRQLVFDRMRAIWIEDGSLIYMNAQFFKIDVSDIAAIDVESFSVGTFIHIDESGVLLRLKNGGRKIFPTGALSESADVISRRLIQSLLPAKVAIQSEPV